jgi:hypothetical protein
MTRNALHGWMKDNLHGWMKDNGMPCRSPDDAELAIDWAFGTVTVEEYVFDDDGRVVIHAGQAMTQLVVYPLLVPPPEGLIDAYRRTVGELRRERDAAVLEPDGRLL